MISLRTQSIALLALVAGATHAGVPEAIATANGPACAKQAPFYWEIGDATRALAFGAVGSGAPTRTTSLGIASASKWPYGAYVTQVLAGNLRASDAAALNFTDGKTTFGSCNARETVAQCSARNGASAISATPGPFYYSGAHMQAHAADGPLAALRAGPLATELNRVLGTSLAYQTPQLAGGMNTSAAAYATFLQRVMSDKLIMGQHLRAATVVTSGPGTSSPIPEPWLYGLGHWIEIDGTLSSPGAFGFYPWISADKALYGIVTRKNITGAWSSVTCGREIRKAFLATATPPAPPIPRPRPRRFVRL